MSEYIGTKYLPDDLTIDTGSTRLSGWQALSVTRGIERFPSTFEVSTSDYDPDSASYFRVLPGDGCTVQLGNDTVLTGYVERIQFRIANQRPEIVMGGRSKACDLLCSVDRQGNAFRNTSVLSLAQQLGQPYGIGCTGLNGAGAAVIPFINFFITQTSYDIIAQAARWGQLLVYDGADGNLVLAQAGTQQTASGFAEGVNIEAWDVDYNITERYSDYRCFIQSTDFLLEPTTTATDPNRIALVQDTGAGIRHRVFSFVAEAGQNYMTLAHQQATWEMNRRRGRSQAVRLTVDSWRDSAGKLWEPNSLATVMIPRAKLSSAVWLISEVTFRRGPDGTHADLVLMPKESFEPQPSNLAQFNPAVLAALTTPADQGRAQEDGSQRRDR